MRVYGSSPPPPSTRFKITTTVVILGLVLGFIALLVLVGGYNLGVVLAATVAAAELALQVSDHLFGGPGDAGPFGQSRLGTSDIGPTAPNGDGVTGQPVTPQLPPTTGPQGP